MRGKDYIMTKPNYNNMRGWTKLGGQMNSREINKSGGVRRQGWNDQSNEYGLRMRHWEWRRMQFFKNASYMKSMATSACHTLSQTFQSEIRVRCANRMRLIPVPHLPDSSNRNWCVYDKKPASVSLDIYLLTSEDWLASTKRSNSLDTLDPSTARVIGPWSVKMSMLRTCSTGSPPCFRGHYKQNIAWLAIVFL